MRQSWDSIHATYHCCGPDGKRYLTYVDGLKNSPPASCCKERSCNELYEGGRGCLEPIRETMAGTVSPKLKVVSMGAGILALASMGTAFLAFMATVEIRRITEAEEVDQRMQVGTSGENLVVGISFKQALVD